MAPPVLLALLGAVICTTALPAHPRLRLLPADIPPLVNTIKSDATAGAIYNNLRIFGNEILKQPPVNDTRNGPEVTLLTAARTVVDRLYTLGLLYRLGIDSPADRQQWLDRAVLEMKTVAGFKDWNPAHFLDVAEFTHSMAVGYDWLYDALSPADRQTIEQGLLRNGLNAGLEAYATKAWWATDDYNWNLVCNGGLSAGAFALYDLYPDTAKQIISNATKGIPISLKSYSFDGAWPEGVGYWDYATHYLEALLDVYENAQGNDNGWSKQAGFDDTGLFPIYSTGPSEYVFNWADCGTQSLSFAAPATMWLGKHYPMHKVYGYLARTEANMTNSCSTWGRCAMELMEFTTEGSASDLLGLPKEHLFFDKAVGVFRTGWTFGKSSPDAWVAFKGCNGSANHGDLDGGQFVWETNAYRWTMDFGPDTYALPGYWTKDSKPGHRFSYYRKGTHGHNTLVFDEDESNLGASNQAVEAFSNVTLFASNANWSYAIVDLTPAYGPQGAKRVQRGFAMAARGGVLLVVDELDFPGARNVTWSAHTQADSVTVQGSAAIFHAPPSLGFSHTAVAQEPSGATWDLQQIRLQPPQEPTNGVSKVRLVLAPVPPRVVVAFGSTERFNVNPLAQWEAHGPVQA